jgi:uncharacterized protein YhaN
MSECKKCEALESQLKDEDARIEWLEQRLSEKSRSFSMLNTAYPALMKENKALESQLKSARDNALEEAALLADKIDNHTSRILALQIRSLKTKG